jgi:hypothetical protein
MKLDAIRWTAALVAVLVSFRGGGDARAQAPDLVYSRVLIDRFTAGYSPTDELIFPTVIRAADHVANPLGTYYLYYAPHDAPGGIALAYASDIQGPYTEYSGNPILTRTHQGRFDVSHVSSPNVVWMAQYSLYFMYFHGENTTTRWAYSRDGVRWDVASDNVALRAADWGASVTETSYARVYEHTIPRFGDRYTMLMMTLRAGGSRRIGLATSRDGKHFTPRDRELIAPGPGEGTDLSGPNYWPSRGRHFVVYHGSTGGCFYTDVGAGFDREDHQGLFYGPEASYPEFGKAADCTLFHAGGRWNMLYTAGRRLAQSIAYAFEVTSDDVVVDDDSAGFSRGGTWSASTSSEGYLGARYLHDGSSAANPGTWAAWKPRFPVAGAYKVMVRWPAHGNRPDAIRYRVYHQGGVSEVVRDQRSQNGSWVYLGRYLFAAGSSDAGRVTLDAGSDAGFSVADAARFLRDP